jgi:hypothetical protein
MYPHAAVSRGFGVDRQPAAGPRRARDPPRNAYEQRRSSAGGWILGLILIAVIGMALWLFMTQTVGVLIEPWMWRTIGTPSRRLASSR